MRGRGARNLVPTKYLIHCLLWIADEPWMQTFFDIPNSKTIILSEVSLGLYVVSNFEILISAIPRTSVP